MAIRGVGEPCANDASLKISGQLIKHLRRRISGRMELKSFFMSSFARMKFGDNSGGVNCDFACIFYRNTELKGPQKICDFMRSKVVGDFRCESSENVAYCYWADAAIFFLRAVRLAEKIGYGQSR